MRSRLPSRPSRVALLVLTLLSASARFGGVAAQTAPAAAPPPSLAAFQWRNIGPANMAGRADAIVASEANPSLVYLGAATGGIWKSVNGGTTWEPVFTKYGTASIGALALFQPNPEIVWAGTGEGDVRNSAGWGDGVYKSTDGGKTFVNVGLRESHHIGSMATHPTNPDILYVAAQGHLWDRGGTRESSAPPTAGRPGND